MLNSKIIIGFVIHLFLSASVILGDPDIGHIMAYIFIPAALCNLAGIILIKTNKVKLGAQIFLGSSIAYIPIGLIGVMGAREILNEINRKQFFNHSSNEGI